ncbi:MAG: hypothetical protein DRK00_00440 [Thermoprotei archaeon]|nr:MAG: hypothetical protein DRK00_00440 [Thermoprotei archaeon]
MEIPEDIVHFLSEAERRGYKVKKVAIAKVPFERYYLFEDGAYVGEVGEEVSLETDIVMCHDDICVLFYKDEPVLVYVRRTGRLEPP